MFQNKRIDELTKEIAALKIQISEVGKKQETPPSMNERVADLEVKLTKLWGLLVEKTPRGKEKLTGYGRRFGGQASL